MALVTYPPSYHRTTMCRWSLFGWRCHRLQQPTVIRRCRTSTLGKRLATLSVKMTSAEPLDPMSAPAAVNLVSCHLRAAVSSTRVIGLAIRSWLLQLSTRRLDNRSGRGQLCGWREEMVRCFGASRIQSLNSVACPWTGSRLLLPLSLLCSPFSDPCSVQPRRLRFVRRCLRRCGALG